jgi:hypothetical protein
MSATGGLRLVNLWTPFQSSARNNCKAAMSEPHLRTAVDDIDLVKRDHMHHLLALLQLPLWALHKLGGWPHGIIVP